MELDELVRQLPELVSERQWFDWDEREERVRAERQQVLGELVLSQRPLTDLSDEQKGRCLLQGIRRKGLHVLPWDESSEGLLRLHGIVPGEDEGPEANVSRLRADLDSAGPEGFQDPVD